MLAGKTLSKVALVHAEYTEPQPCSVQILIHRGSVKIEEKGGLCACIVAIQTSIQIGPFRGGLELHTYVVWS